MESFKVMEAGWMWWRLCGSQAGCFYLVAKFVRNPRAWYDVATSIMKSSSSSVYSFVKGMASPHVRKEIVLAKDGRWVLA
jgi:hypothetical protein